MKEFFKINPDVAVQKNIEFLSGLRNLIVHSYLPELDASIFGECQSSVLNLNSYLDKYFGEKHRIDTFLSFSIQIFQSPKNFIEASKKELKKKNAIEIVEFIKAFRSTLSTEIWESGQFSFKAILIQVVNHESRDTLPIKFINERDLTEEQRQILKDVGIVFTKYKNVDAVPENFTLDYKVLCNKLKEDIPNFKMNQQFHKFRKDIINGNPKLKHTRRLDPKNIKSPKKDFYDYKIIDEFKKKYKDIT
nr:DUF3644 domain-containing protein [Thermodesulfobium narugense]